MKVKATLQCNGDIVPVVALKLEQWLNGQVAIDAFEKFGVGLRVHIFEEEKHGR